MRKIEKMMYPSWKPLTLDGYLEPKGLRTHTFATTFSRVFPRTSELPEVTVGLGVFLQNAYGHHTNLAAPEYLHPNRSTDGRKQRPRSESEFITAVVEVRQRFTTASSNWQGRLLLDLGYVTNLLSEKQHVFDVRANYTLFDLIPEEERDSLLEEHGLHKVATMVAHGHTQNLSEAIPAIDELRGDLNYSDILRLMALGVPLDDIPLAGRLPEELVAELYR